METETTAVSPSRRPRTSLLVLLGIVLVVGAVVWSRNSAGPTAPTSNPRRPAAAGSGGRATRSEAAGRQARSAEGPAASAGRFGAESLSVPAEAAAGSAAGSTAGRQAAGDRAAARPRADRPPPSPPIPLKFIGVTEAPGIGKIAALSDCRHTVQGKEGEEVDGRYRIVKIGIESLIIEYLDGKGRTTLRMSGQDCVAK